MRTRISVLWLTASLFNQHIDQIPDMFQHIKYLLVGGDVLSPKHINKAIKHNPSISIINGYGPTENTTFSTTFNIEKEYATSIPIGKPINNSTVYILSSSNTLQPIGVRGELCVGGDGVAIGYLNNQSLTSEKFVKDPYNEIEILYRTGDLAKWLPDGNIEFLGRVDNQVKVRGFRIELGEIERQLSNHEQIEKTVVLVKEKEGKYLVAYYISKQEIEITQLRNYLLEKLPEYMIPSYFVHLEEFPITANGKIDKKLLPHPELKIGDDYLAPVTKVEKLLVKIWSDILGIEKIGVANNFFALGGDSIKSIQIASRIRNEGYELSIQDLFKHQTIKALSVVIKAVSEITSQDMITGEVPLTPIQNWFFDSSNPAKHHFNQSLMLNFPDRITYSTVSTIFNKLQEHHDALRMTFKTSGTHKVLQENQAISQEASLVEYDFRLNQSENKILEYCTNIQSSIDLEKGPLIKLGLFHLKDGSRLLIVVHHLIIDGVSWRILLEDFETLYHQIRNKKPLALPLKSDSYQNWSRSLVTYTSGLAFLSTEVYWSNILKQKANELPRDTEGSNLIKDSDKEVFQLTKKQTSKLLTEVNSVFGTHINDIFLTAILLSFKKIYGQDRIFIDIESHGRENIIEKINVTRTIGWFTSIYPVLLEYSEGNLSGIIKNVKETIRRVPHNGVDYLIYIQEHNTHKKNRSQISFNYLGQFDSDTKDNFFQIRSDLMGPQISGEMLREYDWDILGINSQW